MSLTIRDGDNVSKTLKTSTDGSDLVPHNNAQLHVSGAAVDSGNPVPVSVSGVATAANQTTQITHLANIADVVVTTGFATDAESLQVAGTDGVNARVLALNTSGHLKIEDGGNTITVDGTVATTPQKASTSNITSVADINTTTTLLSANSSRLGATIYNDSSASLYLKLGATASLTSFSVKIDPNGYYEVPFSYTGIIDGIWDSNSSGSARITELTA
jgi:hypothetical protein